ncbi:MAG: type II secretion system F family protein [Candidatus Woesearchaeota archaeon]
MKIHKKVKEKISDYEQKRIFSNYIKKAGIESDFEKINKKILRIVILFVIFLTFVLITLFIIHKTFFSDAIKVLISFWFVGSIFLYLLIWLSFFLYIDFKIYQRRKEIEAVFPDFLQLAAANINAGMPIDRALWYAIRPKFGILAKEMEEVAKATMVGDSLSKALIDFSNKYDSITIKRTINLLLEGLESGGEIGGLLIKVADNLRETEILKKEMASSVTTYIIFILFATLGAAPFLFGLTTVLVLIMGKILSNVNVGENTQSFGGLGMSIGKGSSVSFQDYQIFAITSIVISCIFAAIITSVIQKGNAKESLKNIPIYVAIGLINYFIAFNALKLLLIGFFQ